MAQINEIFVEVKRLKSEIAAASQEKAEKTGQLSEVLKSLSRFGVKDIAGAKKACKKLEKTRDALQAKIEDDFETLQNDYQW
jgi:septal ring factor EnvC (AmiA/AmiB activator)